MNSYIATFILAISLILPVVPAMAQRNPVLLFDSVGNRSELHLGFKYTSDYVFMGRANATKVPYLSASIGYYHKSGLFLRTSTSYLTTPEEGRFDLSTLSGGYYYDGRRFATGISVTELFFNDLSYTIQAEMSTYLNAYAGYDFRAFVLYMDGGLGFSEGTDSFIGAEINRTFFLLKNRLRITPSAYLNAGSQDFYSEYYFSGRRQAGKAKGSGINQQTPPAKPVPQVLESNKFKVLDY